MSWNVNRACGPDSASATGGVETRFLEPREMKDCSLD